jgi:Lipoate-protein ligase A
VNNLKSKELRILFFSEKTVEKNLALEEAILDKINEGSSPNTLRLWINEKSAILSIHDRIEDTVNISFCLEKGIKINRRITGGGTVYHDEGNLNWSFFVRKEDVNNQDLIEMYRNFSSYLIAALSSLNFNLVFYEPNWIGIENRKISGMAGYIKRNAFLIHGTLLVESNLDYLRNVCKLHFKYPEVANLSNYRSVNLDSVVNTIINYIHEEFVSSFIEKKPEKEEEELMIKLENEKYKSLNWIFK